MSQQWSEWTSVTPQIINNELKFGLLDVRATTDKALPQKLSHPRRDWPNWPSAAVTLPRPKPPPSSSTHLLRKNSSAMSCNHQLSMLILVQNKDYSNRMKLPLWLLDSNVLMQYTFNLCLAHIMCVVVFCLVPFLFAFVFLLFVFFLMATWCKYFHTDNHLWFTTMAALSQRCTLICVQLLPNICQKKPFHYVYFQLCSTLFFLNPASWMQQRSFKIRACLDSGAAPPWDTAGPGSGCVVRGKSGAAA